MGDPSDADFWDKIEQDHSIELVMLALPNLAANLDALEQPAGDLFPRTYCRDGKVSG